MRPARGMYVSVTPFRIVRALLPLLTQSAYVYEGVRFVLTARWSESMFMGQGYRPITVRCICVRS